MSTGPKRTLSQATADAHAFRQLFEGCADRWEIAGSTADILVSQWHGCYDDSWRGLITDEAFAHPAKFAPGLIQRIYAHMLAQGYLRKGDLVGDPFGGIAGGGIMAGYAGFNWFGVELEARFVALGNANLAMHGPKWLGLGEVSCVKLVQGDSREFARIVEEAAGVVTSPPYAEGKTHPSLGHPELVNGGKGDYLKLATTGTTRGSERYGETPGNIGNLKSGTIDAAITSPPFRERTDGGKMAHDGETATRPLGRSSLARELKARGQIEGLPAGSVAAVVSSPPYAESIKGDHKEHETAKESHAARTDPGQGGSLGKSQRFGGYGADRGETYWQAMHQVYRQCLIALRPGGYMAIVVKDYVKDKARVPLCDQTLQLLTALGFDLVERIHAMLVKETTREGLFGSETKKTERKSFFRRLAEKKGSPRIDWEEVLIVRKPGGAA